MKITIRHIVVLLALTLLAGGCAMKKNTWVTRSYKAINTRYNVYFNGKTSYEEGLKNIATAHTEDYSSVIPMYPISKHDNATAGKSNMERAIEKSRKAIKVHSIKQKPERNARKWNDPEYKLWFNQEEFNPALKDAWMLLAQSEFHKADFIGSVGTFTYIARHYPTDKDLIARCQLWIARAYGEMGWIYEAEQVISKLKQDDLKLKNIGLFAEVNADLLLKKRQYKEAIPYLEIALKNEKNKLQKQRLYFLLAQLYKRSGSKDAAFKAFTQVVKLNPPYEMDFNARIYRAELNPDVGGVRKELRKMLKNVNNKDFQDQIFFTLGKTYLQTKDTVKALGYFAESVEKSTRNGFDKALTLITMGDLFYNKQNYMKAQPCYDEASKIITADNEDYARVAKRAETLSELVVQHEIVILQDSLQYLASLPEDKRIDAVNKVIEKLIAEEKAAAEAAELAELKKIEDQNDAIDFMPPIGMGQGAGDWYFYNPGIMKTGQKEFRKKWGTRKLEDNWRRTSKSASMFADENQAVNADATGTTAGDSVQAKPQVTDNKSPEFYLQQIPLTAPAIKKSNEEIATALFNMGLIYKDKVEDYPMAIKTFDEFVRRFGKDSRVPDVYFQAYMLETKRNRTNEADGYRKKLMAEFPDSKYVEVLSDPDYFGKMTRMYREQDSLYMLTYNAYNKSDFNTVKKQVEYVKQNYPLSVLMPKFMFLDALSVGKAESSDKFELALKQLVEKYPESDVSAMSKDILALMLQGKEAKTGSSHGTLLARREEVVKKETETDDRRQFSTDKMLKHRLLLITEADSDGLNKILYNVAAYNFTRFMVKDFDLVVGKLDSLQNMISVTNFDSYDEAAWYVNSIGTDETLAKLSTEQKIRKIIISEENFGLLRTSYSLDEYLAFDSQKLRSTEKQKDAPAIAGQVKKPAVAIETKPTQTTQTTQTNVVVPSITPDAKTTIAKTTGNEPTNQVANTTQTPKVVTPPVQDNVPLFKNLFAFRANEPHFVALTVLSGNFDFAKLKAAFDSYNTKNYGMLNLKLNMETVGKMQVVIIGSFVNADIAKSYLFRMVKEPGLLDALKGTDYRNILGSQNNLNVMMQQNAMSIYFEFMQEYYLK